MALSDLCPPEMNIGTRDYFEKGLSVFFRKSPFCTPFYIEPIKEHVSSTGYRPHIVHDGKSGILDDFGVL
jgi:hypothetical protein